MWILLEACEHLNRIKNSSWRFHFFSAFAKHVVVYDCSSIVHIYTSSELQMSVQVQFWDPKQYVCSFCFVFLDKFWGIWMSGSQWHFYGHLWFLQNRMINLWTRISRNCSAYCAVHVNIVIDEQASVMMVCLISSVPSCTCFPQGCNMSSVLWSVYWNVNFVKIKYWILVF